MTDFRPRIAVSSCLLGNPVRYDGTDKFNGLICKQLAKQFELVAICPEVDAGLGLPRPPVRLTGNPRQPLALGVEDATLDVTTTLTRFTLSWLAQAKNISGLILKSRSPSCGLRDTPVFDPDGEIQSRGPGLFSQIVIQHCPQLPMDDEIRLADPRHCATFIHRVQQYAARQTAQVLTISAE